MFFVIHRRIIHSLIQHTHMYGCIYRYLLCIYSLIDCLARLYISQLHLFSYMLKYTNIFWFSCCSFANLQIHLPYLSVFTKKWVNIHFTATTTSDHNSPWYQHQTFTLQYTCTTIALKRPLFPTSSSKATINTINLPVILWGHVIHL